MLLENLMLLALARKSPPRRSFFQNCSEWWHQASLLCAVCRLCLPFFLARAALGFRIMCFVVSASATSTASATIAHCHPLDTPDYLIPYYLRSVSSRFRHYATQRRRKGGPKYMSVDDFVRALLASKNNEPLDPSSLEGLTQLFTELDADGDTYLSFSEFSLLMVLLTANKGDMQILFSIQDKDCVGAVNLDEFAGVLRGLGLHPSEAEKLMRSRQNGILRRLFGNDGRKRCSYTLIEKVISAIEEEVWKAEFRQVDRDHNNLITAEQFGRLIANHMIDNHVPFHIIENIRRMHGSGDTMTLDVWISFHRVMQHADAIAEAVELFTSSGLPLRKKELNRAVKTAGVSPFTDVELDLIMALFDRNNDGVLQFDEFVSVMKRKLTYHYKGSDTVWEKRSLPTRFVECVQETWKR